MTLRYSCIGKRVNHETYIYKQCFNFFFLVAFFHTTSYSANAARYIERNQNQSISNSPDSSGDASFSSSNKKKKIMIMLGSVAAISLITGLGFLIYELIDDDDDSATQAPSFSRVPTCSPTYQATWSPSAQPIQSPSLQPNLRTSSQPSVRPSLQQSAMPSIRMMTDPSTYPSEMPSRSITPSCNPTRGGQFPSIPNDIQINFSINLYEGQDLNLSEIYIPLDGDRSYSMQNGKEKLSLEKFDIINYRIYNKKSQKEYPVSDYTLQLNLNVRQFSHDCSLIPILNPVEDKLETQNSLQLNYEENICGHRLN